MPTSPTDVAMMTLARRKQFSGLTDKYAQRRLPSTDVESTVTAQLGLLDVAVTVGVYNTEYVQTAQSRVADYQKFIRFYKGEHWIQPYDDGERKPVTNFCQTVVNKSTSFFVAQGFVFKAIEGNEEVAKALSAIWESMGGNFLFRSLALENSMLGDSYLLFYIETTDKDTGKPLPKNKWKLCSKQLTSVCVFPKFNKKDQRILDCCVVQYPTSVANGSVNFTTHIYWPDKIRTYVDSQNDKEFTEVPNDFGFVPIVHFRNKINPTLEFGLSDLANIVQLNEEYNTIKLSVRRIIDYHAEPTTVIFGARASKLEKGAKKLWSNLPVEARVENLAFESDLPATNKYLADVKLEIREEAGLPSVAFQTDNAISNTSGIALRVLYAPLYEKKREKEEAFSHSFQRMIEVMVKGTELLGFDLSTLADAPELLTSITPEYTDALPKDLSADLDADLKKLAENLISKAALVRKYNTGENLGRLTVEILADQVASLAMKREEAVALAGGEPNLAATHLSSVAINEETDVMAGTLPVPKKEEKNDNVS